MKRTKFFFSLLVMLSFAIGNVWGMPSNYTVSSTPLTSVANGDLVAWGTSSSSLVKAFASNWGETSGTQSEWIVFTVETATGGFYLKYTENSKTKYVYSSATKKIAGDESNKTLFTIANKDATHTNLVYNSTAGYYTYNSSGIRPYTSNCYTDAHLYAISATGSEETSDYSITIANDIANGSVNASGAVDLAHVAAGTEITLTATPSTGYEFGEWNVTDASSNAITVTDNKFQMPAANVNVSATFNEIQGGDEGDENTGTIIFGTNNVKINEESVTGKDDLENTWTITTAGTTSFTTNAAYYQVGSSSKPATSITFTTTLSKDVNISKMSAKFGGFSGTAGTVTLTVGENTIGTGNLDGTNDVTVNSTSTASGKVLTVTVTDIAKGVKVYNISYTYTTEGGETTTVPAPTFDVAAGTYTEDQLVLISNYSDDYLYAYTLDGTTPAFDAELSVTNGTAYDENVGIEITSSCTLKAIAVDVDGNKSSVSSAAYVINKPVTFASLAELVAANLTSGTIVTVSFENVAIKSIYKTSQGYRNGIYFDIQKDGNDIEIFYQDVPENWTASGLVSGTMTCPWKTFTSGGNTIWELAPEKNTWSWENLTYTAPEEEPTTPTYANLQALLDAEGEPTTGGKDVIVSFENQKITKLAGGAVGIYMMVGEQEIEIYCATANTAEPAWETRGLVSATELAASWKKYYSTWELVITDWTGISYTAPAPLVLTGLAISGEATALEYTAGDVFNPAGLVVNGIYNNGEETKALTEGFDWEFTPATLSEGNTSVSVKAVVDEIKSDAFVVNDLTVAAADTRKTATNEAAFEAISGSLNSDISYETFKGDGTAEPRINNDGILLYQPASGKSNGGYIVLSAIKGCKIDEVILTTTSANATTIGYSVNDNDLATTGTEVAAEGTWKTDKGLNVEKVSVVCLGADKNHRSEIATIIVKYTGEPASVTGIELGGSYTTDFAKGAEFNHDGMTVTATYSDHTTADVTANAIFSEPNMNTVGDQDVTVSFGGQSATYTINIAPATVTELVLSGDYQKKFTAGDAFNHDGLIVTANYSDGTDNDVTAEATFSTPDMSQLGTQVVIVSFGGKSATYNISVKATPGSMVYETVDFTAIAPYKDLTGSQSETVADYAGASFDMAFAKPQGSNTPTKYYYSGTSVRAYKDNTITITAVDPINAVDIAWTEAKGEDTDVEITGIGTTTAVVKFSATCSFSAITVNYGVAKIGVVGYATLADAVAAVPTDGTETTITLLADVDLSAALSIANTKNVVLDLNGKTIKNEASKSLAQLITVNGKLTVDDNTTDKAGKIQNTASGKYVIKTGIAAAVLTLNNGTIETTTGNSNGAVYGTNGSFVMTGGKIIAAGTGVSSKSVNISGGEITATAGQALCAAGTISGGTFTSANSNALYANQSGKLEITGGSFTGVETKPTIGIYTTDVKVTGATLANGVGFANNATGLLLAGTDAACLNATHAAIYDGETLVGYAPINTGILASAKVSGKTVKLTKDVATTTYLNVTKSFTLDLNGHNIACTPAKADAAILAKGTGSAPVVLTIKGEGKVSCGDHGEGCNAIQVSDYATINIEDGEFSVPGDNSTIYITTTADTEAAKSVVNISGGEFKSGDGKFVLNINDNVRTYNSFSVTGGTFHGFNPANNSAEGKNTNFCAEGYVGRETSTGVFKVVLADTDATLSDLKVAGVMVDGFAAATTVYSVELAYNATVVPVVAATANSEWASVVVTAATELPGATTILVTAESGATQTYTVNFTLAAAPEEEHYYRDLTGFNAGDYGTICLEKAATPANELITYFRILYRDNAVATSVTYIMLEEVTEGLEAGVPYIFQTSVAGATLDCILSGEAAQTAGSANGLVGSFEKTAIAASTATMHNFIITAENKLGLVGSAATVYVGDHRAYIHMEDIDTEDTAAPVAGRRRVAMGNASTSTTTGMENALGNEEVSKVMINGQLFIIRGEKMYNVEGQLVK